MNKTKWSQTHYITPVYTNAHYTIKVKKFIKLRSDYTGTQPCASAFKTQRNEVFQSFKFFHQLLLFQSKSALNVLFDIKKAGTSKPQIN